MGKERGSLERNIFSLLRMHLPWPSFWEHARDVFESEIDKSVFKHSLKERGKHLADCVKVSKLHFVSSTL